MKIDKLLKIGDKINICSLDKQKKMIYYSSKVTEFEKEYITAEAPISEGILVPLEINKTFDIQFNFNKGGYFYVKAELVNRTKERIPQVQFKVLSDVLKIQRRNFFRLDCWIEAQLELVNLNYDVKDDGIKIEYEKMESNNTNNEKDQEEIIKFDSMIKDISGGGMCIQTNKEINEKDLLICKFQIDDKILSCFLKVIRMHKVDKAYKYQIATEYYEIEEKIKDEILKFIIRQQRILIRRNDRL